MRLSTKAGNRCTWELCEERPAMKGHPGTGMLGPVVEGHLDALYYLPPDQHIVQAGDQVLHKYKEDDHPFATNLRGWDPENEWFHCSPFVDMPGDRTTDANGTKKNWKLSLCLRVVRK